MNVPTNTTQSTNANEQTGVKPNGIMGCVIGRSGIGKTSQLLTLPPERTLFYDLEAGNLSVKDWPGRLISPRTWQDCCNIAVILGGVNPERRHDQAYNKAHYAEACKGPYKSALDKCNIIFIDGITAVVRLCLQWCMLNSDDRSGKCDTRNAYGLLAQEMSSWLQQLRLGCKKHIWFTALLGEDVDEFNRRTYCLQMDGRRVPVEFFATLDVAVTMTDEVRNADNKLVHGFICGANEWKYPVKDRSRQLSSIEEPHLGKLMRKILAPKVVAASDTVGDEIKSDPTKPDLATTDSNLTTPTNTTTMNPNQPTTINQ